MSLRRVLRLRQPACDARRDGTVVYLIEPLLALNIRLVPLHHIMRQAGLAGEPINARCCIWTVLRPDLKAVAQARIGRASIRVRQRADGIEVKPQLAVKRFTPHRGRLHTRHARRWRLAKDLVEVQFSHYWPSLRLCLNRRY